MAGTTAILGSAMLPFAAPAFSAEQDMQKAVLKSFPYNKFTHPTRKQMGFFMSNITGPDFKLQMVSAVNVEPDKMIETAFPNDIAVMSGMSDGTHVHGVHSVVRAANKIAYKTRRGAGNFYAVFPDHILVWYRGNLNDIGQTCDTPIQVIEDTIIPHRYLKDYFVKVEGVLLTDEDHAILEKSSTRIT
tara:strand:+ start:147 stop:710 length:564 start_codon:yes stop_codon:yes gene_type:complete